MEKNKGEEYKPPTNLRFDAPLWLIFFLVRLFLSLARYGIALSAGNEQMEQE
jgi:hypothetical protein